MSLIARILTLIFYYTLAAGGHTVNTVEYLFNIQLPPFLLHNPLQLLVGVSIFHPLINHLIQHFPNVLYGI